MITPTAGRVAIKPLREEVKGFELTGAAKDEAPEKGEIVAVGPQEMTDAGTFRPVELAVGDKVAFGRYRTDKFEHEGEVYYVVKASDVLAKL